MLYKIQWFFSAWYSCLTIRARNGVVYFIRLMRLSINTWWQIKLPFCGPKQLRPFQGSIPYAKIFGLWIWFQDICQQLGVFIPSSILQFQRCRNHAFTMRTTFLPRFVICNLHECINRPLLRCTNKSSCYHIVGATCCAPILQYHLWTFCTFIHSHIL